MRFTTDNLNICFGHVSWLLFSFFSSVGDSGSLMSVVYTIHQLLMLIETCLYRILWIGLRLCLGMGAIIDPLVLGLLSKQRVRTLRKLMFGKSNGRLGSPAITRRSFFVLHMVLVGRVVRVRILTVLLLLQLLVFGDVIVCDVYATVWAMRWWKRLLSSLGRACVLLQTIIHSEFCKFVLSYY